MRTPHAWLAFLILLLLAVPANAQRTGARVRGSVADSSGAVIPGATVTLHSDATGLTRTTTTNESGLYLVWRAAGRHVLHQGRTPGVQDR